MKNNELKDFDIKNSTCYDFDNIINIEIFDSDNILIGKKLNKNILVYDISAWFKTIAY